MYFKNRTHAGRLLLKKISSLVIDKKNTIVIALPRGGVPVALEVARGLGLPLDIVLVKKIGLPSAPELAIGAVSEDSEVFYNTELMQYFNLSIVDLEPYKLQAVQELEKSDISLRGKKQPLNLENKDIILIDDGIATGATIEVVVHLLKKKKVHKIIIATPVVSPDVIQKLNPKVDKIVSVIAPQFLTAVGEWYNDFSQVETEEVVRILNNISSIYSSENTDNII